MYQDPNYDDIEDILFITLPPLSPYMREPIFPSKHDIWLISNDSHIEEHLRYLIYLRGKLLSGCINIEERQKEKLELLSKLDNLLDSSQGDIIRELPIRKDIINVIRDRYFSSVHYKVFGLYIVVFIKKDVFLIKIPKDDNAIKIIKFSNVIQDQEERIFIVPIVNPYRSLHVYGEMGLIKTFIMVGAFFEDLKMILPHVKIEDEQIICIMRIFKELYPTTPLIIPSILEVIL